ncbi:hypothetical protein CEXT_786071 [Caerostris extrusa]|uniref:Uncharacterized protein n=1 Tax=Caerostris extrusa TaxID=172846 RepID=A0AAV4VQA2_CAEEX|nr:hypothetical protein CEXT_786071 [Caerostris extrusa]
MNEKKIPNFPKLPTPVDADSDNEKLFRNKGSGILRPAGNCEGKQRGQTALQHYYALKRVREGNRRVFNFLQKRSN